MATVYPTAPATAHKPGLALPLSSSRMISRCLRGQRSPNSLLLRSPHTLGFASSFLSDTSMQKIRGDIAKIGRSNGSGGACLVNNAIYLSAETLRWVLTGSAGLLVLLKNANINKSFLVPLLALQAPHDIITWIRSEYGRWAAFLLLLVRLFYYIPGELELPLIFLLILITAPYQVLDFRGTMGGIVASAVVTTYLAYQHFSRAGIKGAFREGTFLASLAILCILIVPYIFFFGGF